MIDAFFYYSGIITWIVLGTFGLLAMGDIVIDWTVNSVWHKREFMAFVWDRLKTK